MIYKFSPYEMPTKKSIEVDFPQKSLIAWQLIFIIKASNIKLSFQ